MALAGGGQDAAGFGAGERLDVDFLGGRGVDQGGDVARGLAAFPRDLEGAGQDAVDLHDRVRLEALRREPGVEGVEVFGLEPVEAVLAEAGMIQRRTFGS